MGAAQAFKSRAIARPAAFAHSHQSWVRVGAQLLKATCCPSAVYMSSSRDLPVVTARRHLCQSFFNSANRASTAGRLGN